MSLQVNDPRSRTRSKSPGRSRERSRSRDSRVPSPSPSRSRVETPRYTPDEQAEFDRQYKSRNDYRRDAPEPHSVISREPREPRDIRYDVTRPGSDEDKRRDHADRYKRRDDRYDHSDDERIPRREYPAAPAATRPPRRRSPDRGSRVDDSDDSIDDELAYGDAPGAHPSYARPGMFKYGQSTQKPAQHARPKPYPSADIDWASVPECERPGFVPPSSRADTASMPGAFPPASGYTGSGVSAPVFPTPHYSATGAPSVPYGSGPGYAPSHYPTASASDNKYPPTSSVYADLGTFQYAQVDPNVRYTSAPEQFSRSQQPQSQPQHQPPPQPQHKDPYMYSLGPQVVEIAPGGSRSEARPHSLSVSSSNTLAVGGASASHAGHPPASPLLEPYHGTYQSISPMPTQIVVPSIRDDDISDFEPLDGGSSNSESGRRRKHRSHSSVNEKDRPRSSKDKERGSDRDDKRRLTAHNHTHTRHDSSSSIAADSMVVISPTSGRKRVSFYDAAADAAAMQAALNHTRNIDNKTLIQILPRLSSDEMILLRQEYKSRVRMQGKGINIAKHLRLKLGSSSFAKVCYATALGRWESEAYWANCYYQAGTSRRELLIESLMGRSNAAIHEIKNSFRDTRYDNSLEKCMRAELRADKFRMAILLALEGHRQDDREPLDTRLVRQDVQDLHRALVREGGETAMIEIIVLRSDNHLREVMSAYEDNYRNNFARSMIQKSQNLVVCFPLFLLFLSVLFVFLFSSSNSSYSG